MNLTQLLDLIEGMPGYRQLIKDLKQRRRPAVVVLDAAKPYFIAAIYRSLKIPLLLVTAQPENARSLYEQIPVWCDPDQVKLYPEPDAFPYQRMSSDASAETERIQTLAALAGTGQVSGQTGPGVPLVIISAPALAQKTVPYSDFTTSSRTVKPGLNTTPFELLSRWEAMGYRLENMAEIPGTISHRGGIVDIYPPTSTLPARIEFFGNTIDSIRLFDPTSQRSTRAVLSIAISPATDLLRPFLGDRCEMESVINSLDLTNCTPEVKEQFQEELARLLNRQRPDNGQFYAPLFNNDSLLSYLPANALVVLDEPATIELTVADLDTKAEELRAEKIGRGELPGNFPRPYFTWSELMPRLDASQRLSVTAWDTAGGDKSRHLNFSATPSYAGQVPAFLKKAKQLLEQKRRLIIVSHQASRLSELLNEGGILSQPVTEVQETPVPGSMTLVQGLLAEGWVMNDDTFLLTDNEIFGFIKQQRYIRKRPISRHKLAIDITPGEYVVHIEHGIGRFTGVATMSTDSTEKEYLVLQYAAGDRLFVPTDQIDRVSRYIGGGENPPVLSRLGTQEWPRTKQKTKE
ncbi:MAG: CarD family transcriptional regulator, partial [Dehalococcoidales bacterium]|nr:CarD family transcriptional regulator [Dehalococcoidales bacterium]